MDRISNIIGDLESCSFKLISPYDAFSEMPDLVKKRSNSDVHMVGSDKMLINSTGDKGHHQYFYNGSNLW
jgi:hypothetical protein